MFNINLKDEKYVLLKFNIYFYVFMSCVFQEQKHDFEFSKDRYKNIVQ